MSFPEAIRTVFRKYADFEGRAGRPEFWWWILFVVLVSMALNVFSVIPLDTNSSVGTVLGTLWVIGTLLPTLAVGVRRLRDAGFAWTKIFWMLLPIVGFFVLAFAHWIKPSQPAAVDVA